VSRDVGRGKEVGDLVSAIGDNHHPRQTVGAVVVSSPVKELGRHRRLGSGQTNTEGTS
jgi:hypothetical protein